MKTVFISGASAGFGAACARRFAASGHKLVLAARRIERLNELREEIGLSNAHPVELDVRDHQAVEASIKSLPADFARIDVLVNNAGLALGLDSTHQGVLDDWETMIDTNIKGLLFLTRAILPDMVERKSGHIINIGSVAGSWPYPGGNVYGSTKAFVQQFSRNMRCDLTGTHVRVTNIEPGLAQTEFSLVRFKGDKERAAKSYAGKKPLTAEDIAEAVHWASTLPEHVNINSIELMPTCQSWAGFQVHAAG